MLCWRLPLARADIQLVRPVVTPLYQLANRPELPRSSASPAPWPLSWDHIYISHPSNSKVQSGSGVGGRRHQDALASFPTGWYPHHTGRSVFEYHPGFWAEDYPLSSWANWQSFRLFSDPQTQGLFLGSCCALGSGRLRPTRKGVKSYLWLNIYHVPEAYSVH